MMTVVGSATYYVLALAFGTKRMIGGWMEKALDMGGRR